MDQKWTESQLQRIRVIRDDKDWETKKERITPIVEELVEAGVYPRPSTVSAVDMVMSYGERWHQYQQPLSCSGCGLDLCNREHGPPFKKEIGFEDSRLYDGVLYYFCPACKLILVDRRPLLAPHLTGKYHTE